MIIACNCDWDAGEGHIDISKRFLEQDALFRADVLKDLIGLLEAEYNEALYEMREHFDVRARR